MSVEERLELISKGIEAVQDKVNTQGEKLDGMDKEFIEKAAHDVTEKLIAAQEEKAQAKLDDMAAKHADVEKQLIAMQRGGSGDGTGSEAFKQSIAKYLRKGTDVDPDEVMTDVKEFLTKNTFGASENEIEMMAKDLAAGSNPDGGFFITSERSSSISKRIFETSPLRGVANMATTTSDVFEILLDDDEADCDWVGEVSSRPDTDTPQIGLIKIPVHEIYAQPKATQKMLDDAGFDVEGWLANKVATRIGRKENTSFVVGDGSQKPKGFLDYAAWTTAGTYQRNAVEQINSGTNGSFDADDIIGLQNSLIQEYQSNATFGMNRATFTDVMQLKDSQGRYLLNPAILAQGSDKVLLGNDVIFMDDMPVAATDSLSVVIADFNEFYTIVDRFGIRVLRDPYTSKPHVRFYTTKRVGGAVTNYEAGKILKLAS